MLYKLLVLYVLVCRRRGIRQRLIL